MQVGYRVTEDKDFSQDTRKVTRRRSKVPKPEVGHCKKAGAPVLRTLREFKVSPSAVLGCRQMLWPLMQTCRTTELMLRPCWLPQVQSSEGYEPGQQLNFEEVFKAGDKVDIAGNSIGKGFAGVPLACCLFEMRYWHKHSQALQVHDPHSGSVQVTSSDGTTTAAQ